MSMGGSSGGPRHVTQTTKVSLPPFAKPYAKEVLRRARKISYRGPSAWKYPYSTVSRLYPQHYEALKMISNRAREGSPVVNAAQSELSRTLLGDYLSPNTNPYIKSLYEASAGDVTREWEKSVLPQIQAMANRSGAFGGSSHQLLAGEAARGLAQELGDLASNIYGKNYEQERSNQLKSMFFAPQMADYDYRDATALMGVGDVLRQYNQEKLNERQSRWRESKLAPLYNLNVLAGALPTAVGGASSSVSKGYNPYYTSPLSSMFGGAASGIGTGLLAASMGMNPFLAGGLGLIPFLGGLFS